MSTARTLRPDVYLTACAVGIARYDYRRQQHLDSLDYGDDEQRRTPFDQLRAEMLGACGELVCCEHIGARWPAQVGLPTDEPEPDLLYRGIRYEFRTTHYSTGHLQIKPKDNVDVWVLVVAQAPTFTIVGCTVAALGKRAEYRKHPAGRPTRSWWVPQTDLLTFPVGGITRPDLRQLKQEASA